MARPKLGTDRERINFLKHLQEEKINRINPEYNMRSRYGYSYKVAADFFGKEDGSELKELEYFAGKQVMNKEFFDKILLCPYCFHHNINIHETCPADHSADISVTEMLHHYRCGHVGPEKEFFLGIRYVCPKCHKELKHIGVDYEKPGSIYICNKTGELFSEPEVLGQCRNCAGRFDADGAARQDIYAFWVTDQINEVVARGKLPDAGDVLQIVDQDTKIFSLPYFMSRFNEEIARCRRFGRPLSVGLVTVENMQDILAEKGEPAGKKLLKDLTHILKENLRSVDIPAFYQKDSVVNLLLEVDKKTAEKVKNRLAGETEVLSRKGVQIAIKAVSFPDDGKTEEALLGRLTDRQSLLA
ncbi:MAG: diguanylate cyclase [Candidatus Omnitrophota bacterium]